ncbi:hypothetical protein ACFVH9_12965 [Streptomyces hirsutus]|uniref:hypothetical protein n=1 Tax=Streptomyces hirsutus TaxID=35620 RepID=UPI00362B11B6
MRRLLPRELDPALVLEGTDGLSARAEDELKTLRAASSAQSSADPSRRQTPLFGRRRVLGLATVAAAGAAVVVGRDRLGWWQNTVPVAVVTPPVLMLTPVKGDPGGYLRSFAERVARLPGEAPVKAFQYSKQWGWWLHTAVDVPGGAVNAAVPTVTESWVDRDGGGRELRTTGTPIFPRPEQEDQARKHGLVTGRKMEDETHRPGGFFWQSPWRELKPFAHEPHRLARQLDKVNLEGGLIVYGIADLLTYEALSGNVSPRLRAAALGVLADTPRIKVSTSRTWQGKDVVVVTQEKHTQGSTSRNSVFFDPDTGHALGMEEAILDDPLSLNVRVPATLAVTELLERRDVPTTARWER